MNNITEVYVNQNQEYESLKLEKRDFEQELIILIAEIEEYEYLYKRFPEKEPVLGPMFIRTKESAGKLKGKIKAISNLIEELR